MAFSDNNDFSNSPTMLLSPSRHIIHTKPHRQSSYNQHLPRYNKPSIPAKHKHSFSAGHTPFSGPQIHQWKSMASIIQSTSLASKRKRDDEDVGIADEVRVEEGAMEVENPQGQQVDSTSSMQAPPAKAPRQFFENAFPASDPCKASTGTNGVTDILTHSIGMGWAMVASHSNEKQAQARGLATFVQHQSPLNSVQVLAVNAAKDEYLLAADDGYFLFDDNSNRLQLVSRNLENAKQNLARNPYCFEGDTYRTLRTNRSVFSESGLSNPTTANDTASTIAAASNGFEPSTTARNTLASTIVPNSALDTSNPHQSFQHSSTGNPLPNSHIPLMNINPNTYLGLTPSPFPSSSKTGNPLPSAATHSIPPPNPMQHATNPAWNNTWPQQGPPSVFDGPSGPTPPNSSPESHLILNGGTTEPSRSSQLQPPNFSQTSGILNGLSGQGPAMTDNHPNSEEMLQVSIQGMFGGRGGQGGDMLRNTPEEEQERRLVADNREGEGDGDGGMDIS